MSQSQNHEATSPTTTTQNWSKSFSISSRASLTSLKESLPENPHIYHFFEIASTTANFSGHRQFEIKRLSFSSENSASTWTSWSSVTVWQLYVGATIAVL
ncbi:hypothetical protein RIF29_20239 [Crotalaria pallida]|uniref:Uncharacterized protein n=1 Tax=Crotalaria pallida TaxID=3830 RepID=A0AAN9I657_CROPI